MRTIILALLFTTLLVPAMGQFVQDTTAGQTSSAPYWSDRRVVATALSAVIPGAGQSYLGHQTKGAAFTIGFFGAALTAVLAENNVISRNERLNELDLQYAESRSFLDSDNYWTQMVQTKSIIDDEAKRRDTFIKVAAIIWVANIVDMFLFTDEKPLRTFGSAGSGQTTFALTPAPLNGFNASLTVHF